MRIACTRITQSVGNRFLERTVPAVQPGCGGRRPFLRSHTCQSALELMADSAFAAVIMVDTPERCSRSSQTQRSAPLLPGGGRDCESFQYLSDAAAMLDHMEHAKCAPIARVCQREVRPLTRRATKVA